MRVDDVDFEAGSAVIRERKKSRGHRTTRRVPISGFLKTVLQSWLKQHPGGQMLFCWNKGPEEQLTPLNPIMAYEQFRRLVRGSKWDVMKGWHVLRHSFISICVAESVDQRVLQSWVKMRDPQRRPVSDLAAHADAVKASLTERPVRTTAEAVERIADLTGIRRGLTQTRTFLAGLGFKWQRTRAVPVPPKSC